MIPEALALTAAAGGIWHSLRHAWWRGTVPLRHPRILMYHMIQQHRPGSPMNGLRVPPAMFESQLRWLRENGWTFLTMSELVDQWTQLPEKSVALTFDDGYRDNLELALPLIEKYDARATLYLVWDRTIDWAPKKKAHHNSGELLTEPKLTDEEGERLVASGRFELGGHTLTHLNMAKTETTLKRHELIESKRLIESRFQTPVQSFAYPFGIYLPEDVELVREAGYSSAVTVESGIDTASRPDMLQLRRVKVGGKESLRDFALRMRTGMRAWNK
jgi:peptidoglycan/xylan/chitin deacetylase (PgdA/CDA1 family)